MYREALATEAEVRGWSVHWYDPAFLRAMGRAVGPPWQAKHKLAAAAAIAATKPHPGPSDT